MIVLLAIGEAPTAPARNWSLAGSGPRTVLPVRASGEIPSADRGVGAAPALAEGAWGDDDGDRRWAHPTPAELRHDIDHFHLPPPGAAHPESWAEWHYFNVLDP